MENNTDEKLESTDAQQTQVVANSSTDTVVPENKEELTSTNVDASSTTPKKEKKSKKNLLGIILIVVGIACIVGGFIMGRNTASNDNDGKSSNNDKSDENVGKVEETTVFDFSKYSNYKYIINRNMVTSGVETTTTTDGMADSNSGIEYTITSTTGVDNKTYKYLDHGLKLTYVSYDNATWNVNSLDNDLDDSINLKELADKIADNDSKVTKSGDDRYNVIIDINDDGLIYKDVMANVILKDGYITSISYDLTSFVKEDNIEKYVIDITISDINSTGSILIPREILDSVNPQQPSENQEPTQDQTQDPNQVQDPSQSQDQNQTQDQNQGQDQSQSQDQGQSADSGQVVEGTPNTGDSSQDTTTQPDA